MAEACLLNSRWQNLADVSVCGSEQIWPARNQSFNLPLKRLSCFRDTLPFKMAPYCLQRISVFVGSVGVQLTLDSIEETDDALLPRCVCHRQMVCLFWHKREYA